MYLGGDIVFNSKWITTNELSNNLHSAFYKTFELVSFSSAKIRITADDYYKLYVNGVYVGQGPAPAYTFAYNYNEYDITGLLNIGVNKIEILAYYQGLTNRVFVSGDSLFGVVADVVVDNEYKFGTDSSWMYYIDNTFVDDRTVGYDTAYLENRDYRIQNSAPSRCVEFDAPHIICNEPFPALEVYSVSVAPAIVNNRLFYDFGREYVANIRISAAASRDGSTVRILCGEVLDDNNRVMHNMRCGCDYDELCVLKKGDNVIDQFDYKALRYMELELDNDVAINSVELMVRHYPYPADSVELDTDDEALKSVFNLCRDTIKYGTQEVFVDCPTREKGQYIGDVFVSGFSHMILTGDSCMLKKAILNIADSIEYSGRILAVSPCAYKQEIADYTLLYPLMLWRYYSYTKDKLLLEKCLPACDFILDYYSKYTDSNGLLCNVLEQWNLVDWPEGYRDNYDFDLDNPVGCHNVINAFYLSCVKSVERIKSVLNISFDLNYNGLLDAYNNAFYNEQTGLYVDSVSSSHSSLHSNMLPLAFGLCSNEMMDTISDYLESRGMACGTYMSYFFLKALCNAGRMDSAYSFIVSDDKHSWLNMLSQGATSTFEAWDKDDKWNTSLFHPWSTSPIIILYEEILKGLGNA